MTLQFKTNADNTYQGDLKIDKGDFVVIDGTPAQQQTIVKYFQEFLGSVSDDPARGIDWLSIMTGRFRKNEAYRIIRRALLRVVFVRSVLSLSIVVKPNRVLDVSANILLTNGERITV